MENRYMRQIWLVVAVAALAGAITAVAPGSGPMPAAIHATFESAPNFFGNADCPASSGAVLVEGRGTATGTFGPFNSAIGTAQECSSGVFFPVGPPPQLGNCNNIPPNTTYFDVTGKGSYITPDGSVMYLVYHEHSESPFNPDGSIRTPPFTLHDCGTWSIDGSRSTGIFHGATGTGGITAFVPVRLDFSAPVFADYIGTMTLVDGATSPLRPATVNCTGAMTGPIPSGLTVPKGGNCSLESASVLGNVFVGKGGSFAMTNSVVGGNADCIGCNGANMANSTVLGNFSNIGATGGSSLTSNFVTGNLSILNSGPGTFTLGSNIVNGNLTFNGNKGSSTVTFNTVGGILSCLSNTPAPASSGNFAALKAGQCTS
jgi:hypothetical protein